MIKKLLIAFFAFVAIATIFWFASRANRPPYQYEPGVSLGEKMEVNTVVRGEWGQLGTEIHLLDNAIGYYDPINDTDVFLSFEILSMYTEAYCRGGQKSDEVERILDCINEKKTQGIELSYYHDIHTEESGWVAGFELNFADATKVIWYYTSSHVICKIIKK